MTLDLHCQKNVAYDNDPYFVLAKTKYDSLGSEIIGFH